MSETTIQFELFEQGEEVVWRSASDGLDAELNEHIMVLMRATGKETQEEVFTIGRLFYPPKREGRERLHPQLLQLIDADGDCLKVFGDCMPISGIFFKKERTSCVTNATKMN